jgi:integrase
MVSGHLQVKKGYYYAVLSYTTADGKRKQPWIPTGLPEKGNKRKAEIFLAKLRKTYEPPREKAKVGDLTEDMLFADFMEMWLELVRNSVEKSTFSSYTFMVKKKIAPYFREKGYTLCGLEAKHIQSFYIHELQTVSPSTVIKEHANIHRALKYAVKMDLIPFNPADKVERPKMNRYIASYYNAEELEKLFEACKDDPYALLIQMTAFYGFRRSEVIGLKWDAFDFERNTVTVKHVVTQVELDGKNTIVAADRAKTKSSVRSLPLVSDFKEKLLKLRDQQEANKQICGNSYNMEYDGYVFVDPLGNLFKPDNVSVHFKRLLKANGLREIRFHDLRHSCASLLLANDVPMKQIQEWLGHSDISTTANIYSHLDYRSKVTSANVIDGVLKLPKMGSQNGWL